VGSNSTVGDFAKDLADLVESRSFSLIRDGIRYYNPGSMAAAAGHNHGLIRGSAVFDCPRFAGAGHLVERFLQGGV
jgi:hypothetical protein